MTSRTDRTVIISDGELIDPTVANTLPTLDHPQMLQATHNLEKRIYEAGETIIHKGDLINHLYLVVNGNVTVYPNGRYEDEMGGIQLASNQFFGEVELMGDQKAIASVIAGDDPAELALLPKEHFYKIMDESPNTMALVKDIARQRRQENQARFQLEVKA